MLDTYRSLTVIECLLTANTADMGAGIYGHSSIISVQQSQVISNSAVYNGGGIGSFWTSNTIIEDSVIANNSAMFGGGLSGQYITAYASTIADNSAQYGGGFYSMGGHITITQSIISGNVATQSGGGVFTGGFYTNWASAVIDGSQITGNTADFGGGICGGGFSSLEISNSLISHNSAYGGGGIHVGYATLTMRISTLSSNTANEGGGIRNMDHGAVTLNNSNFTENRAGTGGAIYNYSGTITLTNSTLNDNLVDWGSRSGGAIYNHSGSITLENNTLSSNLADGGSGGGIYNEYYGTISVNSSTLMGNSASFSGSSITNYGALTVTASILSGEGSASCTGSIISQGYNIANDNSCDLTGPGDMNSISPQLGPLQDNGGPTLTHMPQPGSPAIDAGDPLNCPPTDQRGIPRPQDGTGDGQAICDIGSVEYLLDAVPLSGVNVTGPAVGDVDTVYTFAATVTPISATQPIIFVWQVAGQATVTQTSGITDTVAFAWSLPGAYALAVTANNGSSSVTSTHTIMLNDRPIAGLLASNSSPANPHEIVTLTAIITSGTNVSYAWEFGDGSSANGQVATHVYAQPGIFTTTVTAINSVSTVSATSVVTILESQYIVYLPFVSIR
jgi:hypothetical protein